MPYLACMIRVFLFVLWITFFSSCSTEPNVIKSTLFMAVAASESGVHFANTLRETDQFNIIEYLYFYNGGGISIGDINNDGLPDLYFTSNQGENKLYLNHGDFHFEDITAKAGVAGAGNWTTGTTMADVNGDGLLDLFVCGVGGYKSFIGRNQLFINNGDMTFTDRTEEYGLSFQGFSTQAAFFDYDNDGDLDMYLLNHAVHTPRSRGDSWLRFQIDPMAGDKLYRNDLIGEGKPRFREVTSTAGIHSSQIGYGLGIAIADVNKDGFPDIWVSNDFHENDYLYINQGNGTFRQQMERLVPHTSRFSMGSDIADMNNDGWPDIFTLDMLPRQEAIIKTTAGEDPYEIYRYKLLAGYHYQLMQNTLQLNRGTAMDGNIAFSDIGQLAGVEATDWSWGALMADFDHDGFKDIFVTNGIVKRPNGLEYINYASGNPALRQAHYKEFVTRMPDGAAVNAFFQNQHNLTFTDVSLVWTGDKAGFSNGAAYADLDNDGDLDLVINNINQTATLYRNDLSAHDRHYLKLRLEGDVHNRFGIGTKVMVYAGGQLLAYQEQNTSRGWQSSVDHTVHVGLGGFTTVDSVLVIWPDRRFQKWKTLKADQQLTARQHKASGQWVYDRRAPSSCQSLLPVSQNLFRHWENDFVPFNKEKLIPHMLSTQGPRVAVGDVNKDSREDFFIGGAAGQPGGIFIQQANGQFLLSRQSALLPDAKAEDVGAAFFDANGDGHLDLIVAGGGQQFASGDPNILPRLYLNDGNGNFKKAAKNIPEIFVDASCVRPADFDGDGDMDLFIGGRVISGNYGIDPKSYLLINDGQGIFTDGTARHFSGEKDREGHLGMVTDAVWVDVNEDGRQDMIVVGEWMPITVLIQDEHGMFQDRTEEHGFEHTHGWWNVIAAYDIDQDGDQDFVVGNQGWNSRLRPSVKEPVKLFISDIDNNGSLEHLLFYYKDNVSVPFSSRDELADQVPLVKREYPTYEMYKMTTYQDMVDKLNLKAVAEKQVFTFSSVVLENRREEGFVISELPVTAQMFPVFAFCFDDLDRDGNVDLVIGGNWYGVQPYFGRYDAGYGLVLQGDGEVAGMASAKGLSLNIKGEVRDIQKIRTVGGDHLFMFGLNNDSLRILKRK